mmetsp:Transcript_13049/g.28985  ORF Transcript_13049/g.28985 Transcript_13049/m.28985 type:complete len:263 (-) Transcript_13049:277-1065(-)
MGTGADAGMGADTGADTISLLPADLALALRDLRCGFSTPESTTARAETTGAGTVAAGTAVAAGAVLAAGAGLAEVVLLLVLLGAVNLLCFALFSTLTLFPLFFLLPPSGALACAGAAGACTFTGCADTALANDFRLGDTTDIPTSPSASTSAISVRTLKPLTTLSQKPQAAISTGAALSESYTVPLRTATKWRTGAESPEGHAGAGAEVGSTGAGAVVSVSRAGRISSSRLYCAAQVRTVLSMRSGATMRLRLLNCTPENLL